MDTRSSPVLVNEAGEETPLAHELIILGRALDCNLIIADRRVSRRHAEVRREENGFVLHDLDSTNGTWLNGRRLSAPTLLRDGDIIEIAGARFTFRDPDRPLTSPVWWWTRPAATSGWTVAPSSFPPSNMPYSPCSGSAVAACVARTRSPAPSGRSAKAGSTTTRSRVWSSGCGPSWSPTRPSQYCW